MSDSHRDLLHYIPLLTTTDTIMFTLCEDLYLRPFTQLSFSVRPTLNENLPHYIGRWFPSGFGVILGRRAKALLDDIRASRSQPDYEDSVAVLAAWLRFNIKRGILADPPAWISFLVGAICR
ncbi:hypothetical protein BDV12DRAFT_202004 [Aspergillus spectabilis]